MFYFCYFSILTIFMQRLHVIFVIFSTFFLVCVFLERGKGGFFCITKSSQTTKQCRYLYKISEGFVLLISPEECVNLYWSSKEFSKQSVSYQKNFWAFFFCKIIPHFSADSRVSYHKVNYFVRRWCFWWMSYIYWNENNFEVNNIVGKK